MRSPYSYGYASDPTFTANRPGLEIGPNGGCVDCAPRGVSMAGVSPVPSGTYMGPVGKTVMAGLRGYGYSSGPGIPDQVALPNSPTMNAAALMSNLGMATPAQRGALRLSGMGLGSTQDRQLCQGITTSIGAVGTASRDINTSSTGTRDAGWNQAGTYLNAAAQIAGSFCNMIQTERTTPVQQQPGGALMPPGYIPPSAYRPPTPTAQASAIPSWALPVGGALVVGLVALVGVVALRK